MIDPGALQGAFRLGQWRIDFADGRLSDGERESRLEPRLLQILRLLVAADGELLSRDELFGGVWPNQIIADQTLDSAMSRLRTKLGDDPKSPRFILTVPKRGYRLLLPALPMAPAAAPEVPMALGEAQGPEPLQGERIGEIGRASATRASAERRPAWRSVAGVALSALALALLLAAGLYLGADRARQPTTAATQAERAGADSLASVAVLPFLNLSDDPDTGYFSDGIAEELLNQLTRVEGLQVASRTSSFRFREQAGQPLPGIAQIARQLGVRYVVEGSVRRSGDELRVTVQLIDAADGFHRWSHTYEQRWENIFDVQATMTRDIVEQIAPKVLPAVLGGAAPVSGESAQAYERYLLGRHYWRQRQPDSLHKAIDYFEQALAIQPDFALALAGLAETYLVMVPYVGLDRAQALAKAEPLLARALSISPDLAESHLAMGHLHFLRAEWAAAEAELRRSLALNRNLAMGHMLLGNVYNDTGRLDEAYASYREALTRDPLHATVLMNLAQTSLKLGLHERARAYLDRARQVFPAHTYLLGLAAHIEIAAGDAASAETLLTQWQQRRMDRPATVPPSDLLACGMLSVFLERWQEAQACLAGVVAGGEDAGLLGSARMLAATHLAAAAAQLGKPEQAHDLAAAAIAIFERSAEASSKDEVAEYERAVAHAQRGELSSALAHLQRSIALGRRDLGWIRHDRRLAPLRESSELPSILEPLERVQTTLRERVLHQFPEPARQSVSPRARNQ